MSFEKQESGGKDYGGVRFFLRTIPRRIIFIIGTMTDTGSCVATLSIY